DANSATLMRGTPSVERRICAPRSAHGPSDYVKEVRLPDVRGLAGAFPETIPPRPGTPAPHYREVVPINLDREGGEEASTAEDRSGSCLSLARRFHTPG